MFEDLRNELNDENVSSDDETNTNEPFDSGNVFDYTDDDEIEEALQETSTSDQFDRFGIYESDVDNEDEELEDEGKEKRILGMTAPQRFMMSVMIFFMVGILGAFCLILSGKIVLPFF
ncbi:MAG: hypothetical protein J7K85_01610 [Anaerolineaceae bacterium]|nr:hypothetical protein [Anaerolineaceae bacterium]